MNTLPPWDSDAYDREVRASRQRTKPKPPKKSMTHSAARGLATDEELARRAEVERAMRRRAAKENRNGDH